jgi:hypothetical protein
MSKDGRSTRLNESSEAGLSLDRRGRVVVYPIAEIFHSTPIEVLEPDVPDEELGAAVRRALAAPPVDPDEARDAHRAELRRLGLKQSELDSSPGASVYPRRRRLEVVQWLAGGHPGAEQSTLSAKASDAELGATLRRLLATDGATTEGPVGATFGYKTAWLAVRDAEPDAVVEALALENTEPVEWEDGVERAHARGVFVSPRTGGWVFALHQGWHDEPPDLAGLSRTLGTEVQHFATHRVVEAHAWTRAEAGRVTRAVRVVGETGEESELGERTHAEQGLELEDVDEETVLAIAGAWSIDPRTLGRVPSESETGIFGFLPRR